MQRVVREFVAGRLQHEPPTFGRLDGAVDQRAFDVEDDALRRALWQTRPPGTQRLGGTARRRPRGRPPPPRDGRRPVLANRRTLRSILLHPDHLLVLLG